MLDVAIKYADALKDKMYETWFDEKYKYWNFSTYYSDIDIKDETWAEHQFVSILDDEIIGYICYEVNRVSNYCTGLGIINFTDNKMTFGCDLGQALTDIFEKFKFNKLKFSVVIGNPIEKSYDRMIQRYGGRIVGIFRQDTRLLDGNLYDVKQYEILRSEYLASKEKGKGINPAETAITDKKPGKSRKQIDTGKIVALHKAGWTNAKIADEMGLSAVTVGKYIKKYYEKAGMI